MSDSLIRELEAVITELRECRYHVAEPMKISLIDWADRLESLLARVRAEPDGWQPIETAPKDGTDVLLGWPRMVLSGHFTYWTTSEAWATQRGEYFGSAAPTHWMPLPATPPEKP